MKRPYPLKTWQLLKRSIAFSCPFYLIAQEEIRLPTGHVIDYFYVTIPPSVMVIPVTAKGRIVLLEQYRYPTKSFSYELPGGNTQGKSPLATGKAELLEETGYRARRWKRLGRFHPYSGMSDEVCYVYLATELTPGTRCLEDREFIQVIEVPVPEVYRRIASHRIRDGMTLASLLLARPYMGKKTQ